MDPTRVKDKGKVPGVKGKGKGHPCKALRLCTGGATHTGGRGIALPFHDHGSRGE